MRYAWSRDLLTNTARLSLASVASPFLAPVVDGAINLNDRGLLSKFFRVNSVHGSRLAVIFHCEFSQNRAPKSYRFFRSLDRLRNSAVYPHLSFPEIAVLEGGYRTFFEQHPDYCEPRAYVSMWDDAFQRECKEQTSKHRKSWGTGKANSNAASERGSGAAAAGGNGGRGAGAPASRQHRSYTSVGGLSGFHSSSQFHTSSQRSSIFQPLGASPAAAAAAAATATTGSPAASSAASSSSSARGCSLFSPAPVASSSSSSAAAAAAAAGSPLPAFSLGSAANSPEGASSSSAAAAAGGAHHSPLTSTPPAAAAASTSGSSAGHHLSPLAPLSFDHSPSKME